MSKRLSLFLLALTLWTPLAIARDKPASVAGVYPYLVTMNNGNECGISAVAPWADRLCWDG